jgi:PAS domain S-box-containing protein
MSYVVDPPSTHPTKCLWELLWDHDPNGLVVVDTDLRIRAVNPAFCTLFGVDHDQVLGQDISTILDDAHQFHTVWDSGVPVRGEDRRYDRYHLHVRKQLFAIRSERVIAGIFVDLSQTERRHERELDFRRETVRQAKEVVDRQMKVAQEIASLLGETTAESKISLLRLVEMVEREPGP